MRDKANRFIGDAPNLTDSFGIRKRTFCYVQYPEMSAARALRNEGHCSARPGKQCRYWVM